METVQDLMVIHGSEIEQMLHEHTLAMRADIKDNEQAEYDRDGAHSVVGAVFGPTPRADAVIEKYGDLWVRLEKAKEYETAVIDSQGC